MTAAIVLLLPADEVSAMAPGPTAEAIDWPVFMGQHDMTYDKLTEHGPPRTNQTKLNTPNQSTQS